MSDFTMPTLLDRAAHLPKPENYKIECGSCHKTAAPDESFKACQKCRTIRYCGRLCQVADWKKHKSLCNIYMAQGAMTSRSMTFGEKGVKGQPSRLEIYQDLFPWAKEHNGDTFTICAWWAMDLAHDMKKAETHFLAVVVRKKAKFASLRASFDLVDATVLPLSLLEEKFQHCGDASTGLPRSPLDQVREDKEGGLRDGALGNVLAMSFVLDAGEEKTIEQTVKEKSVFTLQPLELLKEHYDKFRALPARILASMWKKCLDNALNGGVWAVEFLPYHGE